MIGCNSTDEELDERLGPPGWITGYTEGKAESSPEFSDQEWLDIEAGVAVLLEQIKARSDWARLAKVEDLWLKVRRLNSTR